ncbi:MAG: UDP-glucose dehydrogenase family protein [Saezia sp.]
MNIVVIGTGYVGLVTGACFAEMGNHVTCVDIDQGKIDRLKQGILPIYEPGLEPIVTSNYNAGRLKFVNSLAQSTQDNDIFFIAVGTPPGEDGSADLQYVLAVARDIGMHMQRRAIIVDKSTVPVGTADKVAAAIQKQLDARGAKLEFDVVSNPEFLKEGKAVTDFMSPDRVVIGTDSEYARKAMTELYEPFVRQHPRLVFMGIKDAEMTKYAANAMLATKISFMNEIANMCEKLGVDVENVRLGIGSDQRIGYHFIYPGCGYGGSCFPKDVKALVRTAHEIGFQPLVLEAVEARNDWQKQVLFHKVKTLFGDNLQGKTFAIWGLAFKPGTDDMREAPSKILIEALLNAGAKVQAFDPVAHKVALQELPAHALEKQQIILAKDQYAALDNADALLLVTEWKIFRNPDFKLIKEKLKQPIIFDGRNQYDPKSLRAQGFDYHGIGH